MFILFIKNIKAVEYYKLKKDVCYFSLFSVLIVFCVVCR